MFDAPMNESDGKNSPKENLPYTSPDDMDDNGDSKVLSKSSKS